MYLLKVRTGVPYVALAVLCIGSLVSSKTVDLSFRGLRKEDFFVELQSKINLHDVTVLKLQGNQFDSFLDCSTNLQNLEVLDLSQNHLEKFFFLCKTEYNLRVLNISHNRLEYIDDNALNERITKLNVLDISNNRMSGVNDTMLEHMQVLNYLSLANNPIGDNIDEMAFWKLGCLKTLSLRNVSVTYFSPVLFQTLVNLTDLDLSLNPVEVVPSLPPNIERLDLSGTNLMQLGNLILPNLRDIQLNDMPNLTTVKLNYFENLTNLEILSMKNCPKLMHLKVRPPNARLLPQLQHLSVQNCVLESLSPDLKPILQRVPILDLQNNPWVCDCHMKWVHFANLTIDPEHGIKCRFPAQHRGKRLIEIPEDELHCDQESNAVYAVLWAFFGIVIIGLVVVGAIFLRRSSLAKWPIIRKRRGNTVSYANVVESSNDLVRILPDGDTLRNDE